MNITYYGHSAFLVESAGKSILFDPFISPNPLAAKISVETIMPDFILITHGHGDHITDAPEIAKQSGAMVSGVYEITSWMEKQGAERTHGMNIGGAWNFEFGMLKLVQAVHSSTLPDGSNGGVPCGFVVSNSEDTFYYAGDTALYSDMAMIPVKHHLKTAFLPIGGNFTMDMYDALEAAQLLKVNHVIGMHYDTFDLIRIDHNEARDIFHKKGIQLELMEIGSTITI